MLPKNGKNVEGQYRWHDIDPICQLVREGIEFQPGSAITTTSPMNATGTCTVVDSPRQPNVVPAAAFQQTCTAGSELPLGPTANATGDNATITSGTTTINGICGAGETCPIGNTAQNTLEVPAVGTTAAG